MSLKSLRFPKFGPQRPDAEGRQGSSTPWHVCKEVMLSHASSYLIITYHRNWKVDRPSIATCAAIVAPGPAPPPPALGGEPWPHRVRPGHPGWTRVPRAHAQPRLGTRPPRPARPGEIRARCLPSMDSGSPELVSNNMHNQPRVTPTAVRGPTSSRTKAGREGQERGGRPGKGRGLRDGWWNKSSEPREQRGG